MLIQLRINVGVQWIGFVWMLSPASSLILWQLLIDDGIGSLVKLASTLRPQQTVGSLWLYLQLLLLYLSLTDDDRCSRNRYFTPFDGQLFFRF